MDMNSNDAGASELANPRQITNKGRGLFRKVRAQHNPLSPMEDDLREFEKLLSINEDAFFITKKMWAERVKASRKCKFEFSPDDAAARKLMDKINHMRELPQAELDKRNEVFVQREEQLHAEYFKTVESKELTDEQIHACLWFEKEVLLSAGAGSGKSSVVVGKYGYAVKKKMFQPEEILVLAFNRNAVKDLKDRIKQRLKGKVDGIENHKIKVKTFHSLGMGIIMRASANDNKRIGLISKDKKALDQIEQSDEEAIGQYDILDDDPDDVLCYIHSQLIGKDQAYRELVTRFKNEYFNGDGEETKFSDFDQYERHKDDVRRKEEQRSSRLNFEKQKKECYGTSLIGRRVKNSDEWLIADHVFNLGASIKYRQSPPDIRAKDPVSKRPIPITFYYPDARLWHEHIALHIAKPEEREEWKVFKKENGLKGDKEVDDSFIDKHNRFTNFLKDYNCIVKRRKEIASYDIGDVIVTTSDDILDQTIYNNINREILSRQPSVERPTSAEIERAINVWRRTKFVSLLVGFINGLKKMDTTIEKIVKKIKDQGREPTEKEEMFFAIADSLYRAYNKYMEDEGLIDFDAMITKANTLITTHKITFPYKFVIVDEFQDISEARMKLVEKVIGEDGYLFCVGDDWQAINGFAGSEVSIMTGFHKRFEASTKLYLKKTFRSNHGIASMARLFVIQNRAQDQKETFADEKHAESTIVVLPHKEKHRYDVLRSLLKKVILDSVNTVYFLCRVHERCGETKSDLDRIVKSEEYLRRKVLINTHPPRKGCVNIRIDTLHSTKGLQADQVVFDYMSTSMMPMSRKEDDLLLHVKPVLNDSVDHGEERRLFYVGLTRALDRVYILSPDEENEDIISPFVHELFSLHDEDEKELHLKRLAVCYVDEELPRKVPPRESQ